MIEDMQLRNLSQSTQRAYLHYITGLARFYQTSPEYLSLEELREYQLYLPSKEQLQEKLTEWISEQHN